MKVKTNHAGHEGNDIAAILKRVKIDQNSLLEFFNSEKLKTALTYDQSALFRYRCPCMLFPWIPINKDES